MMFGENTTAGWLKFAGAIGWTRGTRNSTGMDRPARQRHRRLRSGFTEDGWPVADATFGELRQRGRAEQVGYTGEKPSTIFAAAGEERGDGSVRRCAKQLVREAAGGVPDDRDRGRTLAQIAQHAAKCAVGEIPGLPKVVVQAQRIRFGGIHAEAGTRADAKRRSARIGCDRSAPGRT